MWIFDSQGQRTRAVVVRRAPAADLALLRAESADLPCLPLTGGRAAVASDVLAVGSPGGRMLSHTVTLGIVSGYREDGCARDLLQSAPSSDQEPALEP